MTREEIDILMPLLEKAMYEVKAKCSLATKNHQHCKYYDCPFNHKLNSRKKGSCALSNLFYWSNIGQRPCNWNVDRFFGKDIEFNMRWIDE